MADEAQSAVTRAACSAFALGWNVAEMGSQLPDQPAASRGEASSRRHRRRGGAPAGPAPPSPGESVVGELTDEERWDRLVRRVRARLGVLEGALTQHAALECTHRARALAEHPTRAELRGFHVTVSSILMAEDSRWGKAYTLGTALWRLSAVPDGGREQPWYDEALVARAKRHLADLQSSMPAHAAMGVRGSLAMWEAHARGLTWAEATTLAEQARAWRALLSGEKAATQDLGVDDYTIAVQRVLARGRAVVGGLLQSAFGSVSAALATVAILVVVAAGLAVAVGGVEVLPWVAPGRADTAGDVVGGSLLALLGGAGGLGFLKKLTGGFQEVWDTVRSAIVDAALDVAVASAITQLPTPRGARALRRDLRRSLHPSGLTPRAGPSRARR